jgi:hypothetical protein
MWVSKHYKFAILVITILFTDIFTNPAGVIISTNKFVILTAIRKKFHGI